MFSSDIMIALQVQAIESLEQRVALLRSEMEGHGDRDLDAHLRLESVERILNRIYAERGGIAKP
jgi:hypothetical protein